MQAGIAYLMSSLFISGNKSRRMNEPKIKSGRLENESFCCSGGWEEVKVIPPDKDRVEGMGDGGGVNMVN